MTTNDERAPRDGRGGLPDAEFAPPELRERIARAQDDEPEPSRPDRRSGGQRRVAWAGARARNALRRPVRLGVVAGVVFAAALLTLILVPRQAQQAFARLAPRPDEWRDTAAVLAEVERRAAEHEAARRTFLAARAAATTPVPAPAPPPFVPSPEQIARRDSLTAALGALQRGLARVERSPLPASYRALGELPELAAEPRVVALLDSLAAVEREREEFAALGGVDPVYVALTTRLNAIGRAIQEVAAARAAAATAGLEELRPPPPPPTPAVVARPDVDTLGPLNRVVAAEQALLAARQRLEGDRSLNEALAARARSAQQAANFVAPPGAILAAAIVLALVAGYTAALVAELRDPLVADAAEVERETGRRALAVVRPSEPMPERTRRRADERTPDLIDPSDDAYHLLYLHISPTGAALPVVTVTGLEPAVVAAVAANLAAAAAQDARTPLLVDADLEAGLVAGALRVRPAPGVNELLRGEAAWSEVVASAMFGRERTVDVVPAGMPTLEGRRPEPDDAFRRDLLRVSRRYDLTVVAAPLEHAARGARSVLPAPDVVLCVRAAVTRLRDVRIAVDSLQGAGLRVQGVVIWDDALPSLTPMSAAEWRARVRVETARRDAAREAAVT